jgi:hypothetical protein
MFVVGLVTIQANLSQEQNLLTIPMQKLQGFLEPVTRISGQRKHLIVPCWIPGRQAEDQSSNDSGLEIRPDSAILFCPFFTNCFAQSTLDLASVARVQ